MTKAGSIMPFRVWHILYTAPDGSTRVIERVGRNTPKQWACKHKRPGETVSIWAASQEGAEEEGGR